MDSELIEEAIEKSFIARDKMLVVSSCPLRISLVGGSTDHPHFLERYGYGSVISFPSNLRTYSTVHRDKFGANSVKSNYVLNYSRREEVDTIEEIQNELVRHCFSEFNVEEMNLFFTSDVYSSGSGLATSSAYLMSLIKAIHSLDGKGINNLEICEKAMEIEKKFNPLVGQQDFYGSLSGFKRIDFFDSRLPKIKYLSSEILDRMDMFLIHTGVSRNSTEVLKSINVANSFPLLKDVSDLGKAISDRDIEFFNSIIRRTWDNKKKTSPMICGSPELKELDEKLSTDRNVLSHKLLGAGNGGYFLVFTEKNSGDWVYNSYNRVMKIKMSDAGIKTTIH